MARTSDPDSAGSQFFINQRNNLRLDWTLKPGYTVFGEVISGMRIVDLWPRRLQETRRAPRQGRCRQNVPLTQSLRVTRVSK